MWKLKGGMVEQQSLPQPKKQDMSLLLRENLINVSFRFYQPCFVICYAFLILLLGNHEILVLVVFPWCLCDGQFSYTLSL